MRRIGSFLLLIIVLGLALVPAGYRYWTYYGSFPWEPTAQRTAPPEYTAAEVESVVMPERGEFVDEPANVGDGFVLLDLAHENQFELTEIAPLDGRLAVRGYQLLPFTGGDLERQLRGVDAFITVAPVGEFTQDEVNAIVDFVDRGGRLLMMGDPTRFAVEFIEDDFGFIVDFRFNTNEIPLNDLGNEFDITFEGDYLYDLSQESEGNFRNIVMGDGDFGNVPLTDNLSSVAFYGSHSIRVGPDATTVLAGGDNIYSSATDRPGGLTLAAMSGDNVLALGDFTFMDEPYFSSLDNMRLIANIADFLVGEETRDYVLTDFPFLYGEQIDLLYVGDVDLGSDAFDEIIILQDAFRGVDRKLQLAAEPTDGRDTLYLGLYNQVEDEAAVQEILSSVGISLTISPPVLTEDELEALEEAEEAAAEAAAEAEEAEDMEEDEEEETEEDVEEGEEEEESEEEEEDIEVIQQIQSAMGNVQMRGTALILVNQTADHRDVIVLAASKDGLESTVERLLDLMPLSGSYSLADCLTTDTMALCPTDINDEELEAELLTGDEPPEVEADDEEDEEDEDADEEEDESDDDADEADEEDDADESADEEDEAIDEVEDDGNEFTIDQLDPQPTDQGDITLDETIEAELEEAARDGYSYSGDEAVVNLVLEGQSGFDGVLELYDADGVSVGYADSTFNGGTETLDGIEIAEGYTIVVSDFFNDGGSYALTVEGTDEQPVEEDDVAEDEEESADDEEEPADDEEVSEDEEDTSEDDADEEDDTADEEESSEEDTDNADEEENTDDEDTGEDSEEPTDDEDDTSDESDEGDESENEESEESEEEDSGETDGDDEAEEPADDEATDDTADAFTIFLYIDNDGVYQGEDPADAVDIAALIDPAYEITIWESATAEETLTSDDLAGHDMVLWYSSLYREDGEEFAEDPFTILEYALDGNGLLVMGATPPWFEPIDTSEVVDIEIVGDDEILLEGLEVGQTIELAFPIQMSILDQTAEESDEETEFVFVVRGSGSEDAGDIVGIGLYDEFSESRIGFLTLPLEVLEADLQEQLTTNLINWITQAE